MGVMGSKQMGQQACSEAEAMLHEDKIRAKASGGGGTDDGGKSSSSLKDDQLLLVAISSTVSPVPAAGGDAVGDAGFFLFSTGFK